MKSRLVCPKCGGPLSAAITHVTDEGGSRRKVVHYRCQDKACDGEIENPSEFRAFVRPDAQATLLGRWLATHRGRRWTPSARRTPALGGGFAIVAPRRSR